MENTKNNSIKNIFLATILFILYVMFVAYPFLAANQPPNEASSQWAYQDAPIHYGLIYFPAFAIYVYIILRNVLNVNKLRWLVYPIIFIMLFVAVHMVLFIYSMVVLWLGLLTIPIGFITLIIVEMVAISLDIKTHLQKEEANKKLNLNFVQKILDIIGKFIIPLFLGCFLLFNYSMIKFLVPRSELRAKQEATLQCERDKQVIQTAITALNINVNQASYDEISNKFQQEFSKIDTYAPLLEEKYNIVNIYTDKGYSRITLSNEKPLVSFTIADYFFQKKSGTYENSFWRAGTCIINVDENGNVIKED